MGEYVPKIETINLGTVDYTKSAADALYRGVHLGYSNYDNTRVSPSHALNPAYFDWLMKKSFQPRVPLGRHLRRFQVKRHVR